MDIMSKLSYATEIPFKKKMFLPHLEVVSSYFHDSWGMFSMCTPEILSYFFWALFTYKCFFITPGIPPQTRSSTLPYSTVNRASSMPYTIWSLVSFKCYFLCFASRRLFQPFWLALNTPWAFAQDDLSALCLILLLTTHPDSTQPSRSRQTLLLPGSPSAFLTPGAHDTSF